MKILPNRYSIKRSTSFDFTDLRKPKGRVRELRKLKCQGFTDKYSVYSLFGMEIVILGPRGRRIDFSLQSLFSLGPVQFQTENPKIFRIRECFLHEDETFTIVSSGGVLSRWTCRKVQLAAHRLLFSVQVPNTLSFADRIFQVVQLEDKIFILTEKFKLYLYTPDDDQFTDETPDIPFNRIEAQGSNLAFRYVSRNNDFLTAMLIYDWDTVDPSLQLTPTDTDEKN